jgi:hypothetical protein
MRRPLDLPLIIVFHCSNPMGKQLVSVITSGCESSAPFCKLQSRVRTHAVLVIAIGLYEL